MRENLLHHNYYTIIIAQRGGGMVNFVNANFAIS